MKPLVIYHAQCADGFGAAFAAWLKLGDEAEYVPCQYGQVKNVADLNSILSSAGIPFGEGEVYVLDFSFPKDVMEWLFKEVKRVTWLDHHASVFKEWGIPLDVVGDNEYFSIEDKPHWVELNNYKSGAMLAWEYFHPGTEVPMFIRHIDDYDRWIFALEGTKAFQKALWSYATWSFAGWKNAFISAPNSNAPYESLDNFYAEGEAILRAHEQNVQSVVKGGARPCSIVPAIINSSDSYKAPWVWWHDEECGDTCGANGIAANCPPHLASDVGHELANQSGTFGLLWSIDKDNICKCSLRSNGDYDVSAIAKEFGGGGHKNAAGFTTTIQNIMEWTK